jgi:lipid-A-disaccharide synthase-like uncharacterized protein
VTWRDALRRLLRRPLALLAVLGGGICFEVAISTGDRSTFLLVAVLGIVLMLATIWLLRQP